MSTQLREVFDRAASTEVPADMAARAVDAARRRRSRRFVVSTSSITVAAAVLAFIVLSPTDQRDATPRPGEVASLPADLPSAQGLPPLTAESMDAASAAYIVDGEVVVIDAATGEGATVDFSTMGLTFVGVITRVADDASLALSPDGRFLAVVPGGVRQVKGGYDIILMVDLQEGEISPQSAFYVGGGRDESPASSLLAWAPDGQSLACVCVAPRWSERTQLYVIRTSDLYSVDPALDGAEPYDITPSQISWGTDGLVAQLTDLDPEWRLVPVGGFFRANPGTWPPLESVSSLAPGALRFSAVAMGHSDEGGFLGKLSLGKGGDGPLWVVTEDGDDRTVESVPSRPWLGALGDSYFVVLTDWKGDPYNGEVDRVDAEGETVLTTLPPGATTVSFAADLVD